MPTKKPAAKKPAAKKTASSRRSSPKAGKGDSNFRKASKPIPNRESFSPIQDNIRYIYRSIETVGHLDITLKEHANSAMDSLVNALFIQLLALNKLTVAAYGLGVEVDPPKTVVNNDPKPAPASPPLRIPDLPTQ